MYWKYVKIRMRRRQHSQKNRMKQKQIRQQNFHYDCIPLIAFLDYDILNT